MKQRIDELTEQLNQWNKAYYEEDKPLLPMLFMIRR